MENKEDAEDLTQDTLIEAMVNLPELRDPGRFRGWLYEIARGILVRYIREKYKRGTHEPLADTSEDPVRETQAVYTIPTYEQPEECAIAKQHLEIVRQCVRRLPKSEREALLLKQQGLKQKEIAETLGISVDAVKTRLRRGMKNLKQQLEDRYPGEFTYLFK